MNRVFKNKRLCFLYGVWLAVLLLCGGFASVTMAKEQGKNPQYAVVKSASGLYGYIDTQGKVVIKPQFETAREFSDNGLAVVFLYGTSHTINALGKFVTPLQFESVRKFSNGLAVINQNGKYGFIDTSGKFVIAPQFELAEYFTDNGLALVKQKDKYGFIDTSGKFVIAPQFEFARFFSDNGLASVEFNGKWGFVNSSGKFVIQPQFETALPFGNSGLANNVKLNGKKGYINETGKWISDYVLPMTAEEKAQYLRDRPQREATQKICQAQKQSCLATCQGFLTNDGKPSAPSKACESKCNEIRCD